MDHPYESLRVGMRNLFTELGIAAGTSSTTNLHLLL
jgi:hypothetical protein